MRRNCRRSLRLLLNVPVKFYVFSKNFSLNEEYDIVSAVIDSNKVEQFTLLLHNFPRLEDLHPPISRDAIVRDACRIIIYMLSFVHDIPAQFYLDSLKQNVVMYAMALIEKAIYLQDPRIQRWITNLLNEAYLMLKRSPDSEIQGDKSHYSRLIVLTIKCINGENFDFNSINSFDKLGFFYSILCNRYDVVWAACKGSDPLDLQNAVKFLTKRPAIYSKIFLEPSIF